MGGERVEGTRLVDSWFRNGGSGQQSSFRTAGFGILRTTHARSLQHFDTGLGRVTLGLYRDRATCTAGPAATRPRITARCNYKVEGQTLD